MGDASTIVSDSQCSFFHLVDARRNRRARNAQCCVSLPQAVQTTVIHDTGISSKNCVSDIAQDNFHISQASGHAPTSIGISARRNELGLIGEYAFDSRGDKATSTFQNDVILGARLALNDEADTSLLVTSAVDHEHGVASFRLEGQTRIAEGVVASLEGSFFVNADEDPLGADLQDDSFVRLKLTYFW